jgi:hypothetical protein
VSSGHGVTDVSVMSDEERLAIVLREFARTLTTDFPIQGIVDHLVAQIVDVLPVTGAGVTLISHDLSPKYVSASNDAALCFEQLQSTYGDGPCILAYQSGESVAVPDLMLDNRFPVFGPAARAPKAWLRYSPSRCATVMDVLGRSICTGTPPVR